MVVAALDALGAAQTHRSQAESLCTGQKPGWEISEVHNHLENHDELGLWSAATLAM